MKPYRSYQDDQLKELLDPKQAMGYLNAAIEDSDPRVFLIALKDVADAHGGMSRLSRLTKLNREHLYRIFSKRGNPGLLTVGNLLSVLGFRLTVQARRLARP